MRILLVVLLLASVCSQQPSGGTSSGARLAQASGVLDAEVAMPPGFPPDVPIYPHARLTAEASFASSGKVTWGVEWETLDKLARIAAFYQKQLNQGDWTFNLSVSTATTFSGVVRRGSSYTGTLAGDASTGVSKVLLSLVVSA